MRRLWRHHRTVLVVVIVVAAMAAGYFRLEHVRDEGENHLRGESRRRATEICEATNKAIAAAHDGLDRFRDVLISASTRGRHLNADEQAQLDEFNRQFDSDVLAELKPVDCAKVAR